MRLAFYLTIAIYTLLSGQLAAQSRMEPVVQSGHRKEAAIVATKFHPSGKMFATVTEHEAILWDVGSGDLLRRFNLDEHIVRSACFSPDGKYFAVGLRLPVSPTPRDSFAFVYELTSSEPKLVFKAVPYEKDESECHPSMGANCIAITPDNQKLVIAAFSGNAVVWSMTTKKPLTKHFKHTNAHDKFVLSADGKHLLGYSSSRFTSWDIKGKLIREQQSEHKELMTGLAVSPDERWIATCSRDKTILLYDTAKGARVRMFDGHQSEVIAIAFSPDSKKLVSVAWDETIRIWDVATSNELLKINYYAHRTILWSPDGKYFLTDGRSAISKSSTHPGPILTLWNAETGEPVREFANHQDNTGFSGIEQNNKNKSGLLRFNVQEERFIIDVNQNSKASTWSLKTGTRSPWLLSRNDPAFKQFETLTRNKKRLLELVEKYSKELNLTDLDTGKIINTFKLPELLRSFSLSPDNRRIVAFGYYDSICRVLDTQSGELLLSIYLFDGDQEWLAITPDGYFDGSPKGPSYLRYRIGGTNEIVPLERYRAQFDTPGLVAKIFQATEFRDQQKNAAAIATVLDALPPEGKIISPADKFEVAGNEITVTAATRSRTGRPVTAVRLLINGSIHALNQGKPTLQEDKQTYVQSTWKLTLPPGVFRMQVATYDDVTFHTSDSIEIICLGGGKLPPAVVPLRMLTIGISQYRQQSLDFAHHDATELGAAFKRHCEGLYDVHVKTLVDQQATRQTILTELGAMRDMMKENELGVIFFAGHAVVDKDQTLYFLPIDADRNNLATTAIRAEEFQKLIFETRGRKCVLIDACHSGGLLNGLERLRKDLIAEDRGVLLFSSSRAHETSFESRTHGHGMFTQALLEGLSGSGAKNLSVRKTSTGTIGFLELTGYATHRVAELSKDEQHPEFHFPRGFADLPASKP